MPDQFDEVFSQLRRGPWNASPNDIPQQRGAGDGQAESIGWLSDDSVTSDVIRANAVIANKISAGAIETDKLAANAVTAGKIAANTITAGQIAANTITASEIAANTITAAKIAANTITASEIAASAITADELAANSVITTKILAANVTSSRIEASIEGKDFGANSGAGSAPGFFFDSESNAGLWRDGSGVIKLNTLGNLRMEWSLNNISHQTLRPGGDNIIDCGTSSNRWATVYRVSESAVSDERKKMDIADDPLGLAFVRSLRPRVFRWRSTPDTEARREAVIDQAVLDRECRPHEAKIRSIRKRQLAGRISDEDAEEQVSDARVVLDEIRQRHTAPVVDAQRKVRPGKRLHHGLIAQEVKQALDATGVDPMDAGFWQSEPNGEQALSYSELQTPMLKAIQELASENDDLRLRVAALESA